MMTLATKFNWKPAASGWQYDRVTLDGTVLTICKRGRTVAVLAPGLASYFGLRRNRLNVTNYAERLGDAMSTIAVGRGVNPTGVNGTAKAVFESNIVRCLRACNVSPDPEKLAKLRALLGEVHRDNESKPEASAVGNEWQFNEAAREMWAKAISELAKVDLPLAKLMQMASTVISYSVKLNTVNIMATTAVLSLLHRDRAKQEKIEQVLYLVGAFEAGELQINMYAGTLGVGNLSHLGQQASTPALNREEDEIPFDGPVYEEPEEEVTDSRLLNCMAGVLASTAEKVENLTEDLDALEKKLDRYTLLVARRNSMLAQMMTSLVEVLNANLCTPEESSKGRWVQKKLEFGGDAN